MQAIDQLKRAPGSWTVGEGFTPIQYCLSETAEPRCKLQFLLPISVLVTILNFLKVCIILFTAFGIKEDPLMTMGDAVVSFLEEKDLTTMNVCLLSINDVKKNRGYFPVGLKSWTDERCQWKDVTSFARRFVTVFM